MDAEYGEENADSASITDNAGTDECPQEIKPKQCKKSKKTTASASPKPKTNATPKVKAKAKAKAKAAPKAKQAKGKDENSKTAAAAATKKRKAPNSKKPELSEAELAQRAKNSRRSSAYHAARKAAINEGCSEEEAKRRAKAVSRRLFCSF